jgi:hypothetical protein
VTYSQASASTISMAGRMKLAPAATSPGQPARLYPMWMASSVLFGPGIRLTAPSRSMNSCSLSHLRPSTRSRRIMAMCTAGPPKAVKPSLRK